MIKRVGFYQEFGDQGEPSASASAPSLRDAVRAAAEWDEDRIVGYLQSSTEIYSAMGAERDVLTGDTWIPGAGSLVTDGTWLWPAELAHYVRRHHIALPADFVAHIRDNGYAVPALSQERAREIFDEYFDRDSSYGADAQNVAAEPFFLWYVPTLTRASSLTLIKQLSTAGLSVAHPLTDALFGSRETSDGRRAPLLGGPDALAASLADDQYREVEFQCWMGYDQPVTARVRRLAPAAQRVTVRIADVPGTEREEAVAALVRTLDQDAAHCLGFVIDRTGTSAGQDWDSILVGTGEQLVTWPDILGIQRDRLSAHPELDTLKHTEYGPLAVFHRPQT